MLRLLFSHFLLASCVGVGVGGSLSLTGEEVWVIASGEFPFARGPGPSPPSRGAIALALRDVLRDAHLVLGRTPVVLAAPPSAGQLPAGTVVVYAGSTSGAPWLASWPGVAASCLAGVEAHCVLAFNASQSPGGYASIVATGAGVRGAIYGAYSFSEHVLGVNPWYRFTDDPPAFAAPLSVDGALNLSFAPPVFAYRGFFVNDEDLLAALFPGSTLGTASIDSRAYIHVYETLLRLKANTVIPATNPFPDSEAYALASARGLVTSHHHYDLVGGNVFAWPLQQQDWDLDKDPGTMAALWRASIAAQAGHETIWSVGLRGLNDVAYTCPSPAVCGRQITEAMGNQTMWIREMQPDAVIITFLWQELLDLLNDGLLVIPEGVKVIFTDAGFGFIRTDPSWSRFCDGVYYHTVREEGEEDIAARSAARDAQQ